MELDRGNIKKILCLITFTILLYLGVQHLDLVLAFVGGTIGILFPFILGTAIAFVLNVPMGFFEKHLFGKKRTKGRKSLERLSRPVSLILAVLFVVTLILVVVLVVVPELGTTFVSVTKKIEENVPKMQSWIEKAFRKDSPIVLWANTIDFQPQKMLDSVLGVLQSGVNNILSSTISVTVGIVNTAVNIGIAFIFSCYILLQKEKLMVQMKKALYALFPKEWVAYILHVCSLANEIFASFIAGQCIEAVILGSMFFISMTVLHFPYALLVGVLISFTALIPVFGGIIGCWVAFFLILMVSPLQAVMFLGLFLILQQIEGNLIYPHVVGGSVGLPSIWVLVAVTLGGSLMGIVGMLIFIPLVSVVYSLFREWAYKRLKQKKIRI